MQDRDRLGFLKPVGGGDPIPLKKKELVVGRRPSCDIRLDFENVSGRHCMLTYANGTWNVRDLGSTNGTKINNQKLQREQAILPDDELAIATHLFRLDYEPASSIVDSQQILEEEEAIRSAESRKATSLMELAGFSDEGRPKLRSRPESPRSGPIAGSKPAPDPSAPDGSPAPDSPPADAFPPSPPAKPIEDDDFFKLIEDEVKQSRR
ncbi:FHA domain-containing protein [Tautonia sociabilis]|uniref:FHA domain-containing protein n=1 Tax=Tautonia sociabilis TaxID=2080755 RepID=A0A432MJY4_9BACT|nr:FHA domain-containing protein [Tautonia sociabilis]RUL87724.1 FHA domain-containing protein [Tautonia sociabilis]